MVQPRISKGFLTGGQFARKPRPENPPLRGDVSFGSIEAPGDDDDPDSGDRSWLDISEEQRKALLQETEIYLAELAEKVGEPSSKHFARAEALLDKINDA